MWVTAEARQWNGLAGNSVVVLSFLLMMLLTVDRMFCLWLWLWPRNYTHKDLIVSQVTPNASNRQQQPVNVPPNTGICYCLFFFLFETRTRSWVIIIITPVEDCTLNLLQYARSQQYARSHQYAPLTSICAAHIRMPSRRRMWAGHTDVSDAYWGERGILKWAGILLWADILQ